MNLPWIYEPCDTESARTPAGLPWEHAVRGLKPGGRRVTGYGMTEPDAYTDAHEKARQYDAREVIGERGEVVAGMRRAPTWYQVLREAERECKPPWE